ncbi:MAG TPA: hypothetical protein VFO18_16560 [Methylomirabilota bacterium]|nr:hypothetical protein [Methylomirabilota bacterium]
MSRSAGLLLAVAFLVLGCAAPAGSGATSSEGPRARCLGESGRQSASDPMRPLFFFFCVESP